MNDLYTLRKQCINEIITTFAGQKPPKMTACDKRFVDLDIFGYKIKAQQAKYMRTCLLNSDYSFQTGQCPIFLWPHNLDLMSMTSTKVCSKVHDVCMSRIKGNDDAVFERVSKLM